MAEAGSKGLGRGDPDHHGQSHDYAPDFIIRLKTESDTIEYLILETKGFDPLEGIKKAAAERWINAVNVDGKYGRWQYAISRKPETVIEEINKALENIKKSQTEA